MKLLQLIIISTLISSYSSSHGQNEQKLDFKEIEKEVMDKNSAHYYPKLIERFLMHDTSLTENENRLIYYGNVYSKVYSPYITSDEEKKFLKYYYAKKYKKAIPFGQKVLNNNPVNVKILLKVMVSYSALKDSVNTAMYADMYFDLIDVIKHSGDGKGFGTAYVVINISDEYELLKYKDLIPTGQSLSGETDIISIDTEHQKTEPGKEVIKMVYFDVSLPFGSLKRR